jgi:hypothetical protein
MNSALDDFVTFTGKNMFLGNRNIWKSMVPEGQDILFSSQSFIKLQGQI